MERRMFYKSPPGRPQRAKYLRKQLTHEESILWNFLATRPLGYKFRKQYPLHNYVVDFFCYELQMVIEVEGSVPLHQDVSMKDVDRQMFLESKGIKVIRVSNRAITADRDSVINLISSILGSYKPLPDEGKKLSNS